MKTIGLIGIMIIGSCMGPCRSSQNSVTQPVASAEPDLQNNTSLQRECARMFRRIIRVQDEREVKRGAFEEIHHAFNMGKIEQNIFHVERKAWLSEENRLATHAAGLYEAGRSKGCFQKVTQ